MREIYRLRDPKVKSFICDLLIPDSLIELLINKKSVIRIDKENVNLGLNAKDLNDYETYENPGSGSFPTEHIKFVSYIAERLNRDKDIVVTTHSPYVLTSLNNLIFAGQLYDYVNANKKYSSKFIDGNKLKEIIPERKAIRPGDLSAYFVERGKLIDIIDHETGLIICEKIDEASVIIEREFDKLLQLT